MPSLIHKLSALALCCATLSAWLGYPAPAMASAPLAKVRNPGFYKMMLGKFEVTALLDENSPWPGQLEELFPKMSAEEKASVRSRTHLSANVDFSTIAFLVNTGSKLILIDAGGGRVENYGQIFANLQAAGYLPEQVDDVFITHMHPDHIGGLSDASRRNFPNATVHADQREMPQYQAMAAKNNATGRTVLAKITPYIDAGKYQTFNGDTTFYPGLRSIASYGHSDGHSFYAIESDGQKMVFWGDFVVNEKVQFDLPDSIPPGERDAQAGIVLRRKVFGEAARHGYLIGGAHMPFPGVGRLRSLGSSYVFVAQDYAALPNRS
jgi:glyoxylase-like metal-dependent hydrolase (beta-lactamase superfamily II)